MSRMTRILGVAGLALFTRCSGDAGSPVETDQTVVIQPGQATLTAIDATVQLTAEARRNGTAVQATFNWSSLDAAVATVDENGLVRARANGTARVVAASEGAADTAVVTVAQAAAAIGVSPARDTIEAGATVQLVADVNDANGFAIENADVIWESSDTTIAVVNTSGLVTGRFRGEARIRARAAAAEGGTDLTVVLVDFNPTANTTIGGTVAYGRFEIPKGVTVTVTSDLALRALDSLRIAGTLIGDCVEMGILVGGPMRVQGGTIDNSCSTARSTWPALRMVTTDVIDFDSATVIAELLRITNDSVISAPSRSGASAAFSAATAPRPCTYDETTYAPPNSGIDGSPGSPRGGDGFDRGEMSWDCSGDAVWTRSLIRGDQGGNGGAGTATTAQRAEGGEGGDAMDIRIEATGTITLNDVVIQMYPAGDGGAATAQLDGFPEASGGNGGRYGTLRVVAPTIEVQKAVILQVGFFRGKGGDASVTARNGADATATEAAQAGVAAVARGGHASLVPQQFLIGGMFEGTVINENLIQIIAEGPPNVDGGAALIVGGRGGAGNRQFKEGGAGPDHEATGGSGMSVGYVDNRSNAPIGFTGSGGGVQIVQTGGGPGWSDCVVGDLDSGGKGGPGGRLLLSAGLPGIGAQPGMAPAANVGFLQLQQAGNGGSGGNGLGPGMGGDAGTLDVLAGTPENLDSLEPGEPGKGCGYVTVLGVTVAFDPSNHEFVLKVAGLGTARVRLLPDNMVQVEIGGLTMTGSLAPGGAPGAAANFTFTASGNGTISGRTASGTIANGVIEVDAEGRLNRLTGVFTFGAGGELPGGQPVSYNIVLTNPVPF